jgi:hypothetical protein
VADERLDPYGFRVVDLAHEPIPTELAQARREQQLEGRRPPFDTPALRDVSSYIDREAAQLVLSELAPNEALLLAVRAKRQGLAGVLALTSARLLFVSVRIVREPVKVSIARADVDAAAVDDRFGAAALQLVVRGEAEEFSIPSKERAWELLGALLGGMNRFRLGTIAARAFEALSSELIEEVPPPPELPARATEISATHEAADEIRAHGAKLYLWLEDFSRDWVIDKLATTAPVPDIEFESLRGDGFDVLYDARMAPPTRLRIEVSHVPRRRLKVFWDGARWGRRGDAGSGGG